MNELIKLENKNGVVLVGSRVVAENFDKEHRHVLDSRYQSGLTDSSENSSIFTDEQKIELEKWKISNINQKNSKKTW